jgi:hypothetical protein
MFSSGSRWVVRTGPGDEAGLLSAVDRVAFADAGAVAAKVCSGPTEEITGEFVLLVAPFLPPTCVCGCTVELGAAELRELPLVSAVPVLVPSRPMWKCNEHPSSSSTGGVSLFQEAPDEDVPGLDERGSESTVAGSYLSRTRVIVGAGESLEPSVHVFMQGATVVCSGHELVGRIAQLDWELAAHGRTPDIVLTHLLPGSVRWGEEDVTIWRSTAETQLACRGSRSVRVTRRRPIGGTVTGVEAGVLRLQADGPCSVLLTPSLPVLPHGVRGALRRLAAEKPSGGSAMASLRGLPIGCCVGARVVVLDGVPMGPDRVVVCDLQTRIVVVQFPPGRCLAVPRNPPSWHAEWRGKLPVPTAQLWARAVGLLGAAGAEKEFLSSFLGLSALSPRDVHGELLGLEASAPCVAACTPGMLVVAASRTAERGWVSGPALGGVLCGGGRAAQLVVTGATRLGGLDLGMPVPIAQQLPGSNCMELVEMLDCTSILASVQAVWVETSPVQCDVTGIGEGYPQPSWRDTLEAAASDAQEWSPLLSRAPARIVPVGGAVGTFVACWETGECVWVRIAVVLDKVRYCAPTERPGEAPCLSLPGRVRTARPCPVSLFEARSEVSLPTTLQVEASRLGPLCVTTAPELEAMVASHSACESWHMAGTSKDGVTVSVRAMLADPRGLRSRAPQDMASSDCLFSLVAVVEKYRCLPCSSPGVFSPAVGACQAAAGWPGTPGGEVVLTLRDVHTGDGIELFLKGTDWAALPSSRASCLLLPLFLGVGSVVHIGSVEKRLTGALKAYLCSTPASRVRVLAGPPLSGDLSGPSALPSRRWVGSFAAREGVDRRQFLLTGRCEALSSVTLRLECLSSALGPFKQWVPLQPGGVDAGVVVMDGVPQTVQAPSEAATPAQTRLFLSLVMTFSDGSGQCSLLAEEDAAVEWVQWGKEDLAWWTRVVARTGPVKLTNVRQWQDDGGFAPSFLEDSSSVRATNQAGWVRTDGMDGSRDLPDELDAEGVHRSLARELLDRTGVNSGGGAFRGDGTVSLVATHPWRTLGSVAKRVQAEPGASYSENWGRSLAPARARSALTWEDQRWAAVLAWKLSLRLPSGATAGAPWATSILGETKERVISVASPQFEVIKVLPPVAW